MKKEALDGTFGDIYYAKATALRRRFVPTWGVFMNEYEQGGGPLIDIGTHALDLTLWMMNNYKPKYCVGTAYHKLSQDAPENQGLTAAVLGSLRNLRLRTAHLVLSLWRTVQPSIWNPLGR